MKKVLLGAIVLLALGVVGCSSGEKQEKVIISEYKDRLERAYNKTIKGNYTKTYLGEKEDEYADRYKDSENIAEMSGNGAIRDRYKDFVEDISTYGVEDMEINSLHNKLIEVSTNVYDLYAEYIESSGKLGDMEEVDNPDYDSMNNIAETMTETIEEARNQEKHVVNLLKEIEIKLDDK
ncbi:hypothetical protein PN294_11160 [Romboutsia sp. 1001216sp1]|uniref:hypothetical protein n=1 Tax=unclassified Romboutsia TaxID=2626894 RepID=UPI0018A0B01A|nr:MULTISPECIES: hypothetical protein [unclassified Romboutsia]MDB8802751.1 hypothetical protein [Romboutsia sp. 1001216sp1]MDB8814148.1 hypothetical protein [Romboutsia sp. 1001216sp1]